MGNEFVSVAANELLGVKNTALNLMNLCSWLADELDAAASAGGLVVGSLRDILTDLEIGDYSLHGALVGLVAFAESSTDGGL